MIDAVNLGYNVTLIQDLTRATSEEGRGWALAQAAELGVGVVSLSDVLQEMGAKFVTL